MRAEIFQFPQSSLLLATREADGRYRLSQTVSGDGSRMLPTQQGAAEGTTLASCGRRQGVLTGMTPGRQQA